jgi:hypothetical protein
LLAVINSKRQSIRALASLGKIQTISRMKFDLTQGRELSNGEKDEMREEFDSLLPRHKGIKSITLERVTTAMPMPTEDPYSVDSTFMTFGEQVTSQFRHSMHILSSIVISPFWGGKSNFSKFMGHSSMHREQPFWKCKH